MIHDGTTCGVDTPTTDNTSEDFKTVLDFLFRNFEDHPKCANIIDIRPASSIIDYDKNKNI